MAIKVKTSCIPNFVEASREYKKIQNFSYKIILKMAHIPQLNLFTPKKNSVPTNFAYCFRPIYYFSRIFGLLPFTIIYDWNGDHQEARVEIIDFVWFIVSILMYLLMAVYCYMAFSPDRSEKSYILDSGDYILLILGSIISAVYVAMDMHNRHILIDIMKRIATFDKDLMKIGFYVPYKQLRRRGLYWNTTTTVISLVLAALTYQNVHTIGSTFYVISYILCYLTQHFAGATVLAMYLIWIFGLGKRFVILNNLLRNKFLIVNTLPIGFHKKDSISFIKLTGRLHLLLTGVTEQVNRCYSLQVWHYTFI